MKYRKFLKIIDTAENSAYLLLLIVFVLYHFFEHSVFYYAILCLFVIFLAEKTPFKDKPLQSDWFIGVTIGNIYMTYWLLYENYYEIFCKITNPTYNIALGAVLVTISCLLTVYGFKKFTNYMYKSISATKKDVIPFLYRQRLKRLTKRVIVMLFFTGVVILLQHFK